MSAIARDAMELAYFRLNPLWAAVDEHPVDILGFIIIVFGHRGRYNGAIEDPPDGLEID